MIKEFHKDLAHRLKLLLRADALDPVVHRQIEASVMLRALRSTKSVADVCVTVDKSFLLGRRESGLYNLQEIFQ